VWVVLVATLIHPQAAAPQAAAPQVPSDEPQASSDVVQEPSDAYADPQVWELLSRARAARALRAEGLTSFELTFRERLYAGLSGDVVRRERAMYHQERAARVHWQANGDRIVRWLGLRRGVPIVGVRVEVEDDPAEDEGFDLDFDFLDPAEDRVFLGSDWALHPLADTAALHYRYRSGDTLQIRLPGADRTVTLVEAVVEPREARFDRIVASLWFDDATAVLTRAVYRPARDYDLAEEEPEDARPARDYDLAEEEPEDADEVPGFLRPIKASIEYITVDYGFQELKWWLPNRMAFDGTAIIGGLARMPMRLEWSFEDYAVDSPTALDPGEDGLPEGWVRDVRSSDDDEDPEDRGDESDQAAEDAAQVSDQPGGRARVRGVIRRRPAPDSVAAPAEAQDPEAAAEEGDPESETEEAEEEAETPSTIVVIIPPEDSLLRAPELPEPLFSGRIDAFTAEELDELKGRLAGLRAPAEALPPPRLAWGLSPGLLRFNRVEGFSPGARFSVPVGAVSRFETTLRIGIPEWEPHGELSWIRETAGGSLGIGVYRRLTHPGDWGRPLSLGNSLNTLLFGYDYGVYFRETGVEVFGSRTGARSRWEGKLFAERHQNAPKTTDASLPHLIDDELLPENIEAARGEIVGVSGRVRTFSGVDPTGPIVSGTMWGEAATGDFDYGRVAGSAALATPLLGRLTGGLEIASGTTFGNPPAQRLYHLGGPGTLRGFEVASASGEAFWMARAEVGFGFKVSPAEYSPIGGAIRVVLFGDAVWAGLRDEFGTEGYKIGVGAGASFMDGLLRFDLAHGVRGGDEWRLHIYTDGIL
jgi:hypothetical protein